MNQMLTVLKFEYLTFIKSKSFIVMTVIMVLVGLVAPALPSVGNVFSGGFGGDENKRVAVTDASGHFTKEVFDKYLPDYEIAFYNDAATAQNAVTDGSCAFGVAITDYAFTMFVPSMKISFYSTMENVADMIGSEYRLAKLGEAGLSKQEAEQILNYNPPSEILAVAAADGDNAGNYQENIIYAYVMIFLLYFGLIMYGQYILTSVVREKTTKTMELLITSCKSDKLINGKVLGVGMAGLTQMALVVAAALTSMYVSGNMLAGGDAFVVAVKPGIIALMVVFFMLGFYAFAYVYAALGSTVSRMEDANSVATLPMMLIIVGFISAMFGMLTPGVVWVRVLSFLPFVSPMVMFMRVCLGVSLWWEVVTAIVIQAAAIILSGFLSARIYRLGTLMYGNKKSVGEIIRLLR